VRDPRTRVVAGIREACLDLRPPVANLIARREPENDIAARLDRIRQDLIVVGQFLEARDDRIVGSDLVHPADDSRWRGAVGVEEQDVEDHRRGAQFVELRHQLRQQRARPRPLSELLEAVFVDIDDAHRGWLIDPRLQTQELVEDMDSELHERGRLARPQQQRNDHDRQRDQIVQVPADVSPEPPH
jgi:hypothetical protein